MSPAPIASERVYLTDANGIRRLVAAPGDVIPDEVPPYGIVTPADPEVSALQPLDGYDQLAEDEIVAQLTGLSDEQLAAVQAYERAHLARGTIVRYGQTSKVVTSGAGARRKQAAAKKAAAAEGDAKDPAPESAVEEVPAESTSEGYDSMSVEDLQAEADTRELTVAGTGAGGNVLKKDLVTALQSDDAKTDQ